eukprot:gene19675-25593_t
MLRKPTVKPSISPTRKPTIKPSIKPTIRPTHKPSYKPTNKPTTKPTYYPTSQPTSSPSSQPSAQPSSVPTCFPTSRRLRSKGSKFNDRHNHDGPGSGKGTNCSRIAKEYGYIHLCAGDLLREEVNSDTPIPLAELINSYLNEGKVVPADIMVGLLRTAMEKSVNNNPANNKFLIDGFPRDMKNLRCWVNIMTAIVNVQFVLFLDCSKETMLERRIKASGKYDENVETIIKQFETSTLPIIEYFRSINRIREVDANRDLDNVYSNISLIFSNLFIEKSQTNLLSKGYDFQVVFVLGGPGCGKGTNCSLIVKDYGYVHLSAGDLLREERNTGSALADMINTYIKEGKIVPADVTVGLLRAAMEKSVANNPTNNKFLID